MYRSFIVPRLAPLARGIQGTSQMVRATIGASNPQARPSSSLEATTRVMPKSAILVCSCSIRVDYRFSLVSYTHDGRIKRSAQCIGLHHGLWRQGKLVVWPRAQWRRTHLRGPLWRSSGLGECRQDQNRELHYCHWTDRQIALVPGPMGLRGSERGCRAFPV